MGSSAMCQDRYVKYKFDLKGSLIKRITKDQNPKNTTILKDQNILKIRREENVLNFKVD